ncbi:23S rRNA (uracil(1939)-C(5))-methyltransferase RlmD [Aliidiomarina haloalkalitolerans]|uniref:23S rRNA (Uracil(1939)-C(5))-methyltransferase RlmD n=1 Tax=Aliidiomarina haloalkalitolerans TaxID=859059 RepID=A0A432VQF4_9GAMM|nr:23S rRNA (uracil(1939)-C(5))-methyltransferase RlmD [Aliidiomarina haloalkalitolerans]RUO18391.1 23S rRNA (uracil(1939)-C(5))-methyltransferase RlmD [Aliidiomarina haloalkalitolerans]
MPSLFDRHLKEKRLQAKAKKRPAKSQPTAIVQATKNASEKSGNYLQVERLSHDGRGVARDAQGKIVFISGVLPHEEVTVQISASHSRFNEGVARSIKQPSAQRISPTCQHFGECGGCSLQHASLAAQVEFKQASTSELLAHQINSEHDLQVLPEPSPTIESKPYGYRRKARFAVTETKNQPFICGFRARDSKQIIAIHECPVLEPDLQSLVPQLQAFLPSLQGRANIGHVEMIAAEPRPRLLVRQLKPLPSRDKLAWEQFAQQANVTVVFAMNAAGKDSKQLTYQQLGHAEVEPMYYSFQDSSGSGGDFEPIRLSFQAHDFLQVNADVNTAMIQQAIAWIQPQSQEIGLDLFSGFGNFTLPLSRQCRKIVGVEGVSEQVRRAEQNAKENRCLNASFAVANLDQPLQQQSWAKQQYDFIMLDPPRSGAFEICQQIIHFGATRILYVSCNPTTLARDAAILIAAGYRIARYSVIDMFPQTAHSETMVLFERNEVERN